MARTQAQPRPLRELCQTLTVCNVVASGILGNTVERHGLVKVLGPAQRGIRVRGDDDPENVGIRAKVSGVSGGMQRAFLDIHHPWPSHVWVQEIPVSIPPGRHWLFSCPLCLRLCRRLLWPPGGRQWGCRACVRPRYPDKNRLNTLPPRVDAEDELDVMQRELDRLRLIRGRMHRLGRSYSTERRPPAFEVKL
jgi:hypothetical protein